MLCNPCPARFCDSVGAFIDLRGYVVLKDERKQRRRSRRRAHMLLGRKIQDRLKHERAKKRGGGKPDLKIEDLQQAVCNLSDPALIAECDDIKNKIFAALPNNEYRCVFELLAENFTHEQIAEKLGVSVSTIGRRLMQY